MGREEKPNNIKHKEVLNKQRKKNEIQYEKMDIYF